MEMSILDVRRGRPRKFSRPARTVTLTLPDDVIERLGAIDQDLGRAIVRLTLSHEPQEPASVVEVSTFGGRAVILVPPTRRLAALPGVELVPIADGRMLIALEEPLTEEAFELLVRDALEDASLTETDRELFAQLVRVLREARVETRITLRRILVLRARATTSRASRPSAR
jgi:hypothetical protein